MPSGLVSVIAIASIPACFLRSFSLKSPAIFLQLAIFKTSDLPARRRLAAILADPSSPQAASSWLRSSRTRAQPRSLPSQMSAAYCRSLRPADTARAGRRNHHPGEDVGQLVQPLPHQLHFGAVQNHGAVFARCGSAAPPSRIVRFGVHAISQSNTSAKSG